MHAQSNVWNKGLGIAARFLACAAGERYSLKAQRFKLTKVASHCILSNLQVLPTFENKKQVPDFASTQVSQVAYRLLQGPPLRVLAVQLRCIGGQLRYQQEDCKAEASAEGCGPSGDLALALFDTDSKDPSLRSN